MAAGCHDADVSAAEVAIHATGVAIGGAALLILGASGSGKSRLACSLMARTSRRLPIQLIGDDRIVLRPSGELIARPHPRIAGFIERRGLGIVATGFVEAAPVRGVVTLGQVELPRILQNFPRFPRVIGGEVGADMVLAWWRDLPTTLSANPSLALSGGVED